MDILNPVLYSGSTENIVVGIKFKTMDGEEHFVNGKWDFIIAHPPCEKMSKAGARWMFAGGVLNMERYEESQKAKEFFMAIWNADCEKIVVENPTPLKIVGLPKESQVIQPYMFGEPYSKRTLLWEKNVKPLKPTKILSEYVCWMPSNTGGFSRGKGGSRGIAHDYKTAARTFDNIGEAMAEQWG